MQNLIWPEIANFFYTLFTMASLKAAEFDGNLLRVTIKDLNIYLTNFSNSLYCFHTVSTHLLMNLSEIKLNTYSIQSQPPELEFILILRYYKKSVF